MKKVYHSCKFFARKPDFYSGGRIMEGSSLRIGNTEFKTSGNIQLAKDLKIADTNIPLSKVAEKAEGAPSFFDTLKNVLTSKSSVVV